MNKLFRLLLPVIFLASLSHAFAEDEYQSKFLLGKDLLKQARYNAAMEAFKPLTVEAEGNIYVQYSQYFYSFAAFKARKMDEANQMLMQLIFRSSDWGKIDDAYYLLGNVAFEQKKYRKAIQYLQGRDKELKEDIEQMKIFYFAGISNIDTLINLQKDFPADILLAKALAKKLSSSIRSEKKQMLLEYLVQEFELEKEMLSSIRESVIKPSYNVAVLFPFMYADLNTSAASKPNQYVYDMYEGIRLAVDSLKKKGVKINLFAYDTGRDESKVAELLSLPELKSMDMIIGPIYPANYVIVNEFALKNQILVINPLSNNSQLIDNNDFVFLFQPSLRSFIVEASNYASDNFKKDEKLKKVIIFYSPTSKDSLLAKNYRDSILARQFEIVDYEVISRENIGRIQQVLKDSIKLTTVSHIFVASTDQVVAANIVSSMEISGFKIPVITGAEWLQFTLLSYDQFERRDVHFLYPDFLDYNNRAVYDFRKAFLSRKNALPSNHAYQGYEMMILFGNALAKYGNLFNAGLQKEGFISGYIMQGFNYANGNSNSFVPIVRFNDSQLRVVNALLERK
jgi:ABC-type branched-subunit amino acid transport system substrate-binding protein